jgi:hypothetical protein
MRRARTIAGFAILSLAVAASGGSAVGLPGGEEDPVKLTASPERVELVRCIGYELVRVGLHNTTGDGQYADVFFKPTGPLKVSRSVFSSYVPAGYDVPVPLRLTVPYDAAPGEYELGANVGDMAHAPTPVTVRADRDKQCVPGARTTATATSVTTGNEAARAVDGDPATLWQSSTAATAALPQAITLDLGGVYDLNELRYRPRWDGVTTGTITGYTIATSTDGRTFTTATSGTWAADDTPKAATFAAKGVRALRLTATGAVGGVASAAELVPLGVPVDVPTAGITTLNAPLAVYAGRETTLPVAAGNWTADPLTVDVTVEVPAGWRTETVRATLPPGIVTQVPVRITSPAGFPEAGPTPAAQIKGRLTLTGPGRVEGKPTADVWSAPDPATLTYAYDLGPTAGQVLAGYTRFGPADFWRDGAIIGWGASPAPGTRDRAGLDALRKDFALSIQAHTIRLRVPPGRYDVAILRGENEGTAGATIVTLDGETLVPPGPVLPQGEFVWHRFTLDGGPTGRVVDLRVSNNANTFWRVGALVMRPQPVTAPGEAGGTVPTTLALTLGQPASFGSFIPGVAREYTASTTATVTSTTGDATLTVADPSPNAPSRLVNGAFALRTPLDGLGAVKAYGGPVSNDVVPVTFRQRIAADEPLRTGSYGKVLTFTLLTTQP